MAIVSGGVLESKPFSQKTALYRGRNFLSHKVEGGSSLRISVSECSSSNNNNGSVHSDYQNSGEKITRRIEDVILPSHMKERRATRWWLPLFGWSQGDLELWANDDINESKKKGKAMDTSSDDNEKEMEEVLPKSSKYLSSKYLRGRLTPEKAKVLRKNLRDTTTFHDAMYHSAIASRLASPDNEAHG